MTPPEVARSAFGGENSVRMEIITAAAIASAQQKLLEGFVKAALAQWVKFLILPAMSAQTGVLGVVQYDGQGFYGAGDKALSRLLRRTRGDARALTDSLVRHIESRPDEYPEYRSVENITNNVSIAGGVVL